MKSQSRLFLGILLAAFIVILGIYLGRQAPQSQKTSPEPTSESQESKIEEQEMITSGSIVYLSLGTEGSDLYSFRISDKSKKKIFTDKDEDLKIKQGQSITEDGKNLLATLAQKSQEFGGSLWFISTDGKGEKTKLIDSFASPSAPIVSPNGKKIAYTVFSNVEPDYGFSLILASNDGSNKQKLAQDEKGLSNIVFSPDGQNLAFVKNGSLYRIKADGTEEKELYPAKDKEVIYSLSWSRENKIAFSKGPLGNSLLNKAEIFFISSEGKDLKQITNNSSLEDYLSFSPDGQFLAYLSISYEDNTQTAFKTAEIHLMNSEGKNDQSLDQEADRLIGWLP